jgi:CheY-like chemotaxis protein
MGGFVKINSTKGRGTTVRLTIPQRVADPAPCLSIKDGVCEGLIFYMKPEKFRAPEIREFYRNMASNLATGLKAKLYSPGERRELERIIKNFDISHIFTGEEEYETDKDLLNSLSKEGCKVIVAANAGFKAPADNGILIIPKPLYAFPVVRILNGEEGGYTNEDTGRIRFTGISALIVDDEPMNLVVASGLFKEYKMFADTAESGKEALEKYSSGDYDVIFMDHMMPEMDGVEAMKRIRQIADESGRNPIIIALTANALSGAREMFMREGFDGFIAKPIDMAEFERVMKHVLPEELIKHEGRDKA